MRGRGIGAGRHIGDEPAERRDALGRQPRMFRPEVAVGLRVVRFVAIVMVKHILGKQIPASAPSPAHLPSMIVVVGHDLTIVTRAALLAGTMALSRLSPGPACARNLAGMVRACSVADENLTRIVPFEVCTRENI